MCLHPTMQMPFFKVVLRYFVIISSSSRRVFYPKAVRWSLMGAPRARTPRALSRTALKELRAQFRIHQGWTSEVMTHPEEWEGTCCFNITEPPVKIIHPEQEKPSLCQECLKKWGEKKPKPPKNGAQRTLQGFLSIIKFIHLLFKRNPKASLKWWFPSPPVPKLEERLNIAIST